jgi:hypothetical protein
LGGEDLEIRRLDLFCPAQYALWLGYLCVLLEEDCPVKGVADVTEDEEAGRCDE